ncbi:DUF2817 domain-containing protein [Pleurocapsales cyanobacterium LEGE 10410]|nr:DUF2817 domain-containing protein [Pleurocapsales cyanobacterium LEGE 10410]
MSSHNYFTSSYSQARQNFMACASEATFTKSWQHPLRGIEGEKLYVDLAWFGDVAASKVLVLLSGTHGVEGFCGSGIQVGSIKTQWHRQSDRDVAIVMIHSLNPWGMSHWRRVNEDGIDLNRNFLDFQQPLPENLLYDDLAEIIIPQEWTEETQVKTLDRIVEYLYSSELGIEALARGQYHYWYAPFYGGEVPTWSNCVLRKIVQQYFLDKQAIGLLDYHTGLGQYATGQLIGQNNTKEKDLASKIWGDKLVMAGSRNSVAAYNPQGTLISALRNTLTESIYIAAAYEFGTILETEVFHALRADHWLHAHGNLQGKLAQGIKQNMLNAFYCDRPDWQESICNLAFTAQQELLTGLRSIS